MTRDRQFYVERAAERRELREIRSQQLIEGVRGSLRKFREAKGWQPGWLWSPGDDSYVPPESVTATVTAPMSGSSEIERSHSCSLCKKDHPACVFVSGSLTCQAVKCRNPHDVRKRRRSR